jgi:N-acetylglucosamine-6-phosphate deacetylase
MRRVALSNARILDPEGARDERGCLVLEGDRIAGVLGPGEAPPREAVRLDCRGLWLAPGFIDVHHHGRLVLDDADAAAGVLEGDSASLVRHGTTGFLPTTVAWPQAELCERVTSLAGALADRAGGRWPGATPLGIHLEGPWIRTEMAGAQPTRGIRPYDAEEGRAVLDAGRGLVRLVTLAPELPGAGDLLGELARRGIVAALGHSLAGAAAIEGGIARGLRHVTHLFNAMGALHHRERGTAGLALADDRLSCDLICDGVHVHPDVVRVAARAKGDRLLLVTDAIELPGSGTASFGSGPLTSDGQAIRLPDGRLAGSCLRLDRAVRNLRAFAGASLRDAVAACTLRPARLLGIESERGTLRGGARADLVWLDDAGEVTECWVGGEPVWRAPPAAAGDARR